MVEELISLGKIPRIVAPTNDFRAFGVPDILVSAEANALSP